MSTLCAEMWILICLFIVSQLSGVRSKFCPTGWKLHDQTGSCMRLMKLTNSYIDARRTCENRRSNTNKQGHLVFIFDKATDDFVKGLLTDHNVERAFIGLNHRTTYGRYLWDERQTIVPTYTGWSDNPHTPDFNKRAVVITEAGWEEYDADSKANFVCQVDPDFPTPKMTCPVAEEGQESPAFSCSIDSDQSVPVTGVRFQNGAGQEATCDVNGVNCSPGQGDQKYINGDISRDTSSLLSWNLNLKRVIRSDETDWSCSVRYTEAGSWVKSEPCSLKVYTKPVGLTCTHTFLEYRVNATCTASRVYPQAACSWNSSSGPQEKIKPIDPRDPNVLQTSGEQYYTTTCSSLFDITAAGRYNITVSMFPAGPAFESLRNQLAVTGSTSFDVSPPSPPLLYIGSPSLQSPWWEVVENQSLTITCQVPGGVPPVYSTTIECDTIPPESMAGGLAVTITIAITRDWHGRKCICRALHATIYTQTSSVEIRVKFPATVTDFSVTGPRRIIESGDAITFTCTASGNPAPQLSLQRRNGSNLASPSTSNITHTKTAACSDSGVYQCLARNTLNGQPFQYYKYEHLQVTCAPEHCSQMSSHRFPADVTAGAANIQICVRAYPGPTKIILYKGSTTKNMLLNAPRFRTSFQFTSEEDGRGEITVLISPFTREDIGEYMIYSEYSVLGSSNLRFEVFGLGPPSCPTNLTVVKVGSDSVTLSWIAGFNGGLNQNFTVLRVDVTETSAPGHTVLGTVEDQGGHHVYDVTGLSESTEYTFGIEARNKEGSGNCSHLLVDVSTSASVGSGYLVGIIAGAAVALLLVAILVLVVVVVVRRRRGYAPKKTVYATDTVRSGAGDTSRLASSDTNRDDNVYANSASAAVISPSKVRERSDTNMEGQQEPESLYSRFTRNMHMKASKVHDGEGEQEPDSLYSRLARHINRKGDKKRNNENVDSGMADVYQNVSKFGGVKTADQDNVYANASLPNEKGNNPEKPKSSSRTVNDEGLIYVAVEINKKTTYPEIIPARKPVAKVVAMKSQPGHEPVEYIALDFSSAVKTQ
ncbi:hypothetical protein BsWGS_17425 [Bradybaena similaris]